MHSWPASGGGSFATAVADSLTPAAPELLRRRPAIGLAVESDMNFDARQNMRKVKALPCDMQPDNAKST
jgi:hypothetical protein